MFKNRIGVAMSIAAIGVTMTTGVGFAAEKGIVTADTLNIRTGPSTSNSITAKVSKGTELNIISEKNGWCEVSLSDGKKGWASSSYISKTGVQVKQGQIIKGDTYLRASDSWGAEKLVLLKIGSTVEVVSSDANWTKIKYNGKTGYVSNDYIKVSTSSSSTGTTTQGSISTKTGVIQGATYLRASDSWGAEKLVLLEAGTSVEVVSSDANWTKIKYNGKTGYVSNDYIKVSTSSGSTGTTTQGSISTKTGVIQGATYLRASDSWGSEKLVLLEKNVAVKVISSDANWTKVEYNNKIGYVSNDYIKVSTSGGTTTEAENKIGVIVTDSLNVRKGPSTTYSIVTKVTRWEKVVILEESNGWYKIKTADGITGWASGSYIDITTSSTNDSTVNSKIDAVIKLAKAQLGKAYEWGAEGPNTFDCSGLVWYVYKNAAGINLPRTSKEQAKYGTAVSKENMKAGDLVAFDGDKNGTVEHIGIYIGNGEFIHSPRTGDVVKITSLSTTYYKNGLVAIRRIIK